MPAREPAAHGVAVFDASFRSKLVHKKSGFAILTDPTYHHLFEESELELIRKHVPWTRLVGPTITTFRGAEWDLLSLISKHREEFVLKPNDDYGGRGVLLGWQMNSEDWQAALTHARKNTYVVQERVNGLRTRIPAYSDRVFLNEMYVDLNPFLFEKQSRRRVNPLVSRATIKRYFRRRPNSVTRVGRLNST